MKPILLLIAMTGLLFLSCNRQNDASQPGVLWGSWRMIGAEDNASGVITTKPAGTEGNVDLTFTATTDTSGSFYGHTPNNTVSPSNYLTTASRQLQVLFLSMTKVGETNWGNEFVDNILNASMYSFDGDGKLVIKTERKTLTFQKL